MTPCPPDNSTWCCGEPRGCCGTTDAVTIPPTFGAQTSTSTPPTATITIFTVSTSSNCTLDGGVIAGIVVGVLGAAAIPGVATWIMSHRRARRQLNSTTAVTAPRHELVDQALLPQLQYWTQSKVRAAELDSRTQPPEIDSRGIEVG